MKKMLLVLSLLSTVGFAKGLVVKGGIEYNYFQQDSLKTIKEMKVKDFTELLTEEKLKELIKNQVYVKLQKSSVFSTMNEQQRLATIEDATNKVLGKIKENENKKLSEIKELKRALSELKSEKVKSNYLSALIGVDYGFEVYRKEKLAIEIVPGFELKVGSKIRDKKEKEQFKAINYLLNADRNQLISEIKTAEEDINMAKEILKNKDTKKLKEKMQSEKEITEEELATILGQIIPEGEAILAKMNKYLKQTPENKFGYSVVQVEALATVSPKITYDVTEDVTLKAGVKLGLGINHERIDYKYTAGEVKKVHSNITNQLVVPYKLTLGVDYKHLSTDLEIGGKYLTEPKGVNNVDQKYKGINVLTIGLNVGYKF